MATKKYSQLEKDIIEIFQRDRLFLYQKEMCKVILAGKPRPHGRGGECKTDVFVRAQGQITGVTKDIKLSVKTEDSQEFQENKVTSQKAEAYFGADWERIVCESTAMLKEKFENRILLYASGLHPTKPNSITVGWKLEIASKPRALSVKVPLSEKEIRDYVYRGTNQPDEKINAIVNGNIIQNAGIADYLLVTNIDKIKSANDIIQQMVPIDFAEIGDTYMIFTANNYRTDVDKADGPRALAVRIEWECRNHKLIPLFYYDHPLMYTGQNDMRPLVLQALRELGKKNIEDIDPKVDLISENIFLQ